MMSLICNRSPGSQTGLIEKILLIFLSFYGMVVLLVTYYQLFIKGGPPVMYVVKDGIKIHFKYSESIKVTGNGGTIVLIHGMGMDMSSWDDLTPFLVYHYNVLRFDLRGHKAGGRTRVACPVGDGHLPAK
ncbi:alpha/beta fold hydrolase [Brevibacillus fluminis]|uniref:alpha/beta fold hydrolase n=1 Tax=Brevibacillus fluminis TaxID=511487 RepID=UPI003F8A118A